MVYDRDTFHPSKKGYSVMYMDVLFRYRTIGDLDKETIAGGHYDQLRQVGSGVATTGVGLGKGGVQVWIQTWV